MPPPQPQRLSKSKYLSGLQCHKRLYLETYSPELAAEIDEQTEARLEMGKEVGQLAHQRFPGGVLVGFDAYSQEKALERTAELMKDPKVPAIFEGAFEFENVLVYADILGRVGKDKWRLIEVKSSTSVKDEYLPDLAIQTYVLDGSGVTLAGSWLMYLNNQYAYQGGDLDLMQLFALEELTSQVSTMQSEIPGHLASMRKMSATSPAPVIEPDDHCYGPYECKFWEHCTAAKPPRWVYHLPRIGKKFEQLRQQGIESIDDIPANFKLSVHQQRMKDNVEWISPQLKTRLETVRYPVHYLDFETVMLAIPRHPMTRPYQTLPTQWSNHIEMNDGTVKHREYLCTERKDPHEEVARTLLEAIGREGSICVFSNYEERILTALGKAVPSLKGDLDNVIDRLWDLQAIIRDHYYHPKFEGSFSLKKVLPAVLPDLGYSDLEIQHGGQAAQQYYHMIFEEADPAEKGRIQQALLKYCERDTLAMVELRRALLRKALTQAGKIPSP